MLSLRHTGLQEGFVRLRWAERAVMETRGVRRGYVGGTKTVPAGEGAEL